MSNSLVSSEKYTTLLKAFEVFQQQSDILEKSHYQLKEQLKTAQLDLAEKNKELAQSIKETNAVKEQLASTLESLTDAVILLDNRNCVLRANASALSLLHCANKSDIENLLLNKPKLKAIIESQKLFSNKEVSCNINHDTLQLLLTLAPVADAINGQRVLVIKDISDYRLLQERVERENRLSELGQVAASVAHEIRNPLSAVEGFARLLERDLNGNSEKMAGKIVQATRQLNYVVSNLLNYTKDASLNLFPSDLSAIVEQSCEIVIPMAEDREIAFIKNLETEQSLYADAPQLNQVILNLTINAIQACPVQSDGHIEISTFTKNNKRFLTVSDNGCGIPKDKIPRLFDPFFTMKDGGIGLGLAMCQRIIDLHRGKISCQSTEGQGTQFTIELPISRETQND